MFHSHQLSEALGVAVPAGINANGVCINTRTLKPGELFVCIKGEQFDGHDYAQKAMEKGAAAVISSRQIEHAICVPNTLKALEQLAIYKRTHTQAKVIGITGSVGKTSITQGLKTLLSKQGNVFGTKGNFNNHIGMPLTLANLPDDADYVVLEMGMNHAGELTALSALAQPDVALISTVEAVHLEFFENVEAIAEAKAEILSGVVAGGIAILNSDNAHYNRLREVAKNHQLQCYDVGQNDAASHHLSLQGEVAVLRIDSKPFTLNVHEPATHHFMNAALMLAAVNALGADVKQATRDVAQLTPPKGRGGRHSITLNGISITLIDDSYNASPASMQAAFDVFSRDAAMRKIVVLGDMLELGETAPALHTSLLPHLLHTHAHALFTTGPHMASLGAHALPHMHVHSEQTAEALVEPLMNALKEGDAVLVKGSHGSGLYRLVNILLEKGAP